MENTPHGQPGPDTHHILCSMRRLSKPGQKQYKVFNNLNDYLKHEKICICILPCYKIECGAGLKRETVYCTK